MEFRRSVNYAEKLPGWKDLFDKAGVLRCEDTEKLPPRIRAVTYGLGAKALLCCAIMDEGVVRGFVGFECSVEKRAWTQEQVGYLTTLAEVLSMFLLKKRSKESANAWASALKHMMANKNGWIQVIRDSDYGLRFLNDAAGKLNLQWDRGVPCYRALMGRDTPCECCPVKRLGEVVEVDSPVLGKTIRAEAVYSSWEGENVYLLMCEDGTAGADASGTDQRREENRN